MFDFVRKHTRLALGFMLLLIIPSFIFFGVQGYSRFSDSSSAAVATVNGQGITRNEWEDASKRFLYQLRQESPNIDPAKFDTPQLRRDTLDALVRDRVLLAAANQLHLFPTVPRMQRLFLTDPQLARFRNPDGSLSREALAMQGDTPDAFDQRYRQQLGVMQVLGGITQTVLPPVGAASAALDALMQRRAVQMQRFEPAAYRSKVTPTDAEIEAYFKAHESQFKAPEQATIDYVVLDLALLAKAATVADADVRKAYDDNPTRFTTPEERRASHILIKAEKDAPAADRAKAKAKAEALLAELRKTPGQFAELARKNSDDPGSAVKGGDLDFFGRGQMVGPFEATAFKLKIGEISDVVETDFGYHIITVTGVRGGQVKPFEEVRAELEAELRKTAAQRRWSEAAETFTNTVYEQSDSLQPVIDKLKLQKQTATVQRTPVPGATGVLASTKLLDAVFGKEVMSNKRNTDAVEVGPNQIVSARIVQYVPARTLPLAEVKDKVRDKLIDEQSMALARKDGEAKLAALKAGSTEPLPIVLTVSRAQAQALPGALLDAVLRADLSQQPAAVGVDLGVQGYVVIRVMQVLPREVPPGGDEPLRAQYAQAWATAESDAYIASLKKRFKAEIKPAADVAVDAASAPGR